MTVNMCPSSSVEVLDIRVPVPQCSVPKKDGPIISEYEKIFPSHFTVVSQKVENGFQVLRDVKHKNLKLVSLSSGTKIHPQLSARRQYKSLSIFSCIQKWICLLWE